MHAMDDQKNSSNAHTHNTYMYALRQASLRKLTKIVMHQCNDLIPTHAVLEKLDLNKREDRGIQRVPLHQIVGSTGRYNDFDLKFKPLHKGSKARWTNIANRAYRGYNLPPILLYQVGEAFFVEDGNHRVSVARATGKEWIQAHIIEIDSSALTPEPACLRLGFTLTGSNYSCTLLGGKT